MCGGGREAAEGLSNHVLRPSAELVFDAPDIGTKTVADVLANPERYVDQPLADPIEGPEYGEQTAMVLRRPSGEIFIHSFAHGEANYRLIAVAVPTAAQGRAPPRTPDVQEHRSSGRRCCGRAVARALGLKPERSRCCR